MKSAEIRQAFFDYFIAHDHVLVPSSSLVPAQDPSLLFTNAGMVQFKNTFLGLETRPYQKALSSQCCVRAGGKHNDLENVGYTARHHTFFEMLGNFSFGAYFKREAIQMAWEFLTQVLHLAPERLWVTVYEQDKESEAIWLEEMKVSPQRFSRCKEASNFWSMGDTGPCGPCTEIFYDHGPKIAGGPPGSPDEDGDRYVEIWNLVFMQYNRDKEGVLHPLPHPSVDTGMGLERISAVVQGVHDNYSIDLFKDLLKAIQNLFPEKKPAQGHPSLKVIADHIRACSFLISDGVLPDNEGRGYVLRRIIRRAIRHGHHLGLASPFFWKLVQPLSEVMGEAYPALISKRKFIEKVLLQEEEQFSRTLQQGLALLATQIKDLKSKEIPGDVAFKLYDTYGFPLDLTADIAREQGLTIDLAGFESCMQKQRELSQAKSQFQGSYIDLSKADWAKEKTSFHGYTEEHLDSVIIGLIQEGRSVSCLEEGMEGTVVLNHTPFYAESGGQVGDQGKLLEGEACFVVQDTQYQGQTIVHHGRVEKGSFPLNAAVKAVVDSERRQAIRLNHTATHLLHAALRQILGLEVEQKGSLVDATRARFDFSHPKGLSCKELAEIESLVNAKIRENHEVMASMMSLHEAKESGAMALFGEKYQDDVRVLSIAGFSKELCGGTHVARTGDIGLFKIISEAGIATGVRRIEFLTGHYALSFVNQHLAYLDQAAAKLKINAAQLDEKLSQFLHDIKQKEKEGALLQKKLRAYLVQDLLQQVKKFDQQAELLIQVIDQADMMALRAILDDLQPYLEKAIIVLIGTVNEKMYVVAKVSKLFNQQVTSAVDLVKRLCGQGGGRADLAQGGGLVPSALNEKIIELQRLLETEIVNIKQ